MPLEGNELFEFDEFRVDTLRRLLLRRGEPLALTSKAFDTLAVLIRNRGRVVEKGELLKTIWPDSFVEESNLAQHISALRKALGDQPGENRYIATVPGRGYRFVAEVTTPTAPPTELVIEKRSTAELVIEEEVELNTPQASARRSGLQWVLLVGLPVLVLAAGAAYWSRRWPADAPPRSVAVLPFRQLGATADDEYLGLGLTDAVITRLSNIRQLIVRPTSSVLKYAEHPADLTIPGRELGVEAVLDGQVQKSGDSIRVSVQLIRTADNRALWAENFDTQSAGIFNIEDSVSSHVAQALAIRLAAPEKQQLARGNTINAEAYRDYMQGRYASFHFTSQGLQQAIDYFNRAIALDPSYALAYSGLADSYTTTADWVLSPHEALTKAEAAARQALAVDDSLAEAHASLGHALMHQWRLADADKEFRRAQELGPNQTFSYFFYAEYLAALRRYDESVAVMRKAIQLDPESAELRAFLSWPLALKGDYAGALQVSNEAIRIQPDFWVPHMTAAYSLLALHQLPESIAEFEKARTMNPASTVTLAGLATAWVATGKRSEAAGMLTTFHDMSQTQYVSPMDVAAVHAALGENDLAFQWLDKAFDDQSEMLLFLRDYAAFAPVRGDPRFVALLHRVGVGE